MLCGKLECLAALCRLASPHSWVHSLQGDVHENFYGGLGKKYFDQILKSSQNGMKYVELTKKQKEKKKLLGVKKHWVQDPPPPPPPSGAHYPQTDADPRVKRKFVGKLKRSSK